MGAHAALPIALALALALLPVPVQSQSDPCSGAPPVVTPAPVHHWSAPLDRTITVREKPLALDRALTRLAELANLRLSFSPELLPSGRTACLSYRDAPIGDVLTFMLRESGLEPAVVGADQIVLMRPLHTALSADEPVVQLNSLYATAEASREVVERTPAFSVTVLDASRADWRPGANLVEVLNSSVPGMMLWSASATGITASYGSTRGASSFGVSAPKILIDGIEVANPLLLSHITMDAVQRIEIIRGPQGSARYGADALNGVTNIITRHDTSSTLTPHIQASSSVGFAGSQFASDGALTQDHSLRLQMGRNARSLDLDLGAGSIGAYAPGAGMSHRSADASMRVVGSNTVFTGTFRLLRQSIDTAGAAAQMSSLGDGGLANAFSTQSFTEALSLREYTAGINAAWAPGSRWTHSLVIGVDGYRLGGVSHDSLAAITDDDLILRDAGIAGTRMTFRANSVARFAFGRSDVTATFTADHTRISQTNDSLPSSNGKPVADEDVLSPLRTSTGASTEIASTLPLHFSVTGAVRIERNAGGTAGDGHTVALPMLGGAWRRSVGGGEVTVRASYGKGVRWPSLSEFRDHMQLVRMSLEPETQTGFETGLDVRFRRAFTLQVTHFDQTASGLTQQVTLPVRVREYDNSPQRYTIELQNVGAISNDGWEAQMSVRHGPFALASAATFLDSRVLRVASGYRGDLRPGDHPLAVPARTLSVTASVTGHAWSTSLTAYRAASWVNYDRIAMSNDSAAMAPSGLRQYWKTYDGFTHLGLNASRNISRGVVLTMGASNLLNRQTGEPDNITIVPGRSWSLGIRANF